MICTTDASGKTYDCGSPRGCDYTTTCPDYPEQKCYDIAYELYPDGGYAAIWNPNQNCGTFTTGCNTCNTSAPYGACCSGTSDKTCSYIRKNDCDIL